MKLILSILFVGFFFLTMQPSGQALSTNMGEDSGTYCERCRNSGPNCSCNIGPTMKDWDCKCHEASIDQGNSEVEMARRKGISPPDQKNRPTTIMDSLQKNLNMPSSTQMGFEAERPSSAPPQ